MAVGARPFIVGALAIFSALFLHLISAPPPHNKEWNERCSLLPYQHFWLQSNRVITPNGTIPAAVEINEGKIISIVKRGTDEKEIEASIIVDYGNAVIMPGLIDVHVHLNEPGREWEGFETGTRAAAAGGVTTIIDMPLNTAPTTITKEALLLKVNTSIGKLYVDVGFWGGLVPENAFNTTTLTELLDAGVLGLKSFMSPSGINDFPNINAAHLKEGLQILSSYGRPLLVHAEIPQPSLEHGSMTELDSRQRRLYSTYLETRPPSWEVAALQEILPLAKDTAKNGSLHGSHLHIVHLSDADTTLDLIKEAKAMGASISVETCPHYLLFSAEEIEDGDTRFKCAPPIRDEYNKLKLWKALNEGDIDMLSSDHSPSNPELKLLDTGDFLDAWGGISSLQFGLPATWTSGKHHGLQLNKLSELWSSEPSKLVSLQKKGSILAGKDADLVVWDPEAEFEINKDYTVYHRHSITAYEGRKLSGKVISTFVSGNLVYEKGQHASSMCGSPILATRE